MSLLRKKPFNPHIRKSVNSVTIPLILLLLISMATIVLVHYQNSDKLVERQVTEEYVSILANKKESLERTIVHILGSITAVMNRSDTYDVVSGQLSAYEKHQWINEARSTLYYDISSYEGFSVLFYAENGFYFYKGDMLIRCGDDFQQTSWYGDVKASSGAIHWFGMRSNDVSQYSDYFHGAYRQILTRDYGSGTPIETITYFSLNYTQMDNLMSCQNGVMYLVNQDGVILYATDQQNAGGSVEELGLQRQDLNVGRDYKIVSIADQSEAGEKVAIVSPPDDYGLTLIHMRTHISILKRFNSLQLLFYLFFFVVLIFTIYYVMLYFRMIQRPLKQLFDKISGHEQGYFPVTTGLKKLDDEFNRVMLENRNNLSKINEFERNMQLAEMNQLQAELDPHFLYNILNHVRLAAIMDKPALIRQIIEAIFTILENKRQSGYLIPVAKEVATLEKYIEIIQILYNGNVTFTLTIDPTIQDLLIPSFILQPIVENAVHHGINPAEPGGQIHIAGERDKDGIRFVVSDNGRGIRADAIAHVYNSMKRNSRHIGILNIDKKIKLCCGDAYGVRIESSSGKGARITLRIALITAERDEA